MKTNFFANPLEITVKEIVDENFQDYKKSSMFIATSKCDFKCLKELNLDCSICQNMPASKMPNKKVFISDIYKRYESNKLLSSNSN